MKLTIGESDLYWNYKFIQIWNCSIIDMLPKSFWALFLFQVMGLKEIFSIKSTFFTWRANLFSNSCRCVLGKKFFGIPIQESPGFSKSRTRVYFNSKIQGDVKFSGSWKNPEKSGSEIRTSRKNTSALERWGLANPYPLIGPSFLTIKTSLLYQGWVS